MMAEPARRLCLSQERAFQDRFHSRTSGDHGLVAEQVEKVNPDLVGRDEQGKPYTVRYEAVNAMMLNEFLKEHRKVQIWKLRSRHSTND